jgi:Sec7-like guanine-nucleotide exchange factor
MAAFLINESGLSKRAIGEYLGEKEDFNVDVLKQYAHMHDFFSKDIVDALRLVSFFFKSILLLCFS